MNPELIFGLILLIIGIIITLASLKDFSLWQFPLGFFTIAVGSTMTISAILRPPHLFIPLIFIGFLIAEIAILYAIMQHAEKVEDKKHEHGGNGKFW